MEITTPDAGLHAAAIAAIYARAALETAATFDVEGKPVAWGARRSPRRTRRAGT